MATLLTSRNNPLIKEIRSLSTQKRKSASGLVLAEGLRVLDEARHAHCDIRVILIREEFGARLEEERALNEWKEDGVRTLRVKHALFNSVSSVINSQGVIAVISVPQLNLEQVRLPSAPLILCACGLQDPGNLGTLIRTAFAAGASLVLTSTDTVSARNPKCIRSSAGAFFRLPVIEQLQPAKIRSFCEFHDIRLLGTNPACGMVYSDADFLKPTAILLGNEGSGITGRAWSDLPQVRIPMAEGAESLNVASAGAILFFEAFRQRAAGGGY